MATVLSAQGSERRAGSSRLQKAVHSYRCAEGHKGREELRGLCEVQGVTLQPLAGSRTHQRCSQAAEHTQPSRLPGGHPVSSLSLLRAVLGGSK